MRDVELCRLDELADPGSRGFDLDDGATRLFVVLREGVVHAYRNRCPHTGAPLEWTPDRFLDLDNHFIQCAIHGALFQVEDGYCVRGPCAGESLQALDVRVEGGSIRVSLPDPEPAALSPA